jgi:hypothetical protein
MEEALREARCDPIELQGARDRWPEASSKK